MSTQQHYYTLITDIGLAKEAGAHQSNKPRVQLAKMAIGDGAGKCYQPTSDMTALKHEVYRADLNQVYTAEDNPNQLITEAIIPADIGGFVIREVGIIDSDGDLFAIGNYPETKKPVLASGAGKDIVIRMVLGFSTTPSVYLTANTHVAVVTADQFNQVNQATSDAIDNHNNDITAHHGAFDGVLDSEATSPTGLHNRYFDITVTDYGSINDSQPFAAERIPPICSDLARGKCQHDYKETNTGGS